MRSAVWVKTLSVRRRRRNAHDLWTGYAALTETGKFNQGNILWYAADPPSTRRTEDFVSDEMSR